MRHWAGSGWAWRCHQPVQRQSCPLPSPGASRPPPQHGVRSGSLDLRRWWLLWEIFFSGLWGRGGQKTMWANYGTK